VIFAPAILRSGGSFGHDEHWNAAGRASYGAIAMLKDAFLDDPEAVT
jgi:hypothetical protein